MKYLRFLLYSSSLIFCFILGIGVGLYKWFPFQTLQVLNKTIKNKLSKNLSNDELLFELAKTNNIEIPHDIEGINLKSPLIKSDPIRFISYGDNQSKKMNSLMDSINKQNVSLVVHLGDTESFPSLCTNSYINLQRDFMSSLDTPVLFTPGDNDWLDCSDKTKGEYYNLERLANIRETFFSKNKNLGKKSSIFENQSVRGYPENARIIKKNVAFISAHVVGGNNNFDPFRKKNILEYLNRDQANIDWITESFETYKEATAYVVAIHANIFKNKKIPFLYEKFAYALFDLSNKYKKPVLLLHGDIHKFKAYQPMKSKYPFLHVIQNFGYPDLKALEIEVNPSKKIPFNVIKIIE